MVVVPAILPTSRADLVDRLTQLSGLVTSVQIDVVDGRFAMPATWPYADPVQRQEIETEDALLSFGKFSYEIDLMVRTPESEVGAWVRAGANKVTLHIESMHSPEDVLTLLEKEYGYDKTFAPDLLSVGFAINIATDTAILEPYLERISYVQFMGIRRIGHQGEPFDEEVVRKISAFRRAHPDIEVQVDGGVALSNAPALLEAGARQLVVGSDIWRFEDVGERILAFEELGEKYGLYH